MKACDTLFYDYPSFETELRNLLTVALLDELKFLGCPDFARQDNRDELLGSLPFPDKALRTGTALERGENKLGLQGDFGCVVERLIGPIRSQGVALHQALKD